MDELKSILVVDDEQGIVTMLEEFLEDSGYQVLTATHPRQAQKLYREQSPDLIITDIVMPDINGIEMLNQLITEFPQLKAVVMTGYAGALKNELEQVQSEQGVVCVMEKPLNLLEVLAMTNMILAHPVSHPALAAEPA